MQTSVNLVIKLTHTKEKRAIHIERITVKKGPGTRDLKYKLKLTVLYFDDIFFRTWATIRVEPQLLS